MNDRCVNETCRHLESEHSGDRGCCYNCQCDFFVAEIVDQVVEAVRADLLSRSKHGIEKYGKTLDRNDLGLRDWLQHAYEECLDQANYLKRAIIKLDDENVRKEKGAQE